MGLLTLIIIVKGGFLLKDFIYENKIWLGIILSLVLIIIGSSITYIYFYSIKEDSCVTADTISSNLLVEVETEEEIETEEENYIYIDVKGAVENPGVYKIEESSIVNDAITMAGGFSKTAITSNINLSKILTSEMVIYVYDESDYTVLNSCEVEILTDEAVEDSSIKSDEIYIDDDVENNNSIIDSSESSIVDSGGIVNINTAGVDEFMTLSGIGESKAEAIIAYREENGLFLTVDELINVSGIGESTVDAIKEFITV